MLKKLFSSEAVIGILLLIILCLTLFIANSPLYPWYEKLITTPWLLNKSLLFVINEGLMAFFFLLLSLEIKREMVAGELRHVSQIILPCVAALGGVFCPALIYLLCNWGNHAALQGWAIPVATDVALVVGLLALLGKGIPPALRIFLLVLAIFDDLIGILVIAGFYTVSLSWSALGLAMIACLLLLLLNYYQMRSLFFYLLIGLGLWVAVLNSGVHATLAGVVLGFSIPYVGDEKKNPLLILEHSLEPWVNYLILPIFILANAGVPLTEAGIFNPVSMGIALGLFLGKQWGVFGSAWLCIRLGFAKLPKGSSWWQLYGAAILAGIGFTMSLFLSNLAFNGSHYALLSREGILLGSFLSAIFGVAVLYASKKTGQK